MNNWEMITHISAAVIVVCTGLVGVAAALTAQTYGRPRWTAALMPAYGLLLVVLSYRSVYYACAALGFLAPFLSQSVTLFWTIRTLGPEYQRRQLAQLLRDGGGTGFFLSHLAAALVRSSVGIVVLLMSPRVHPMTWLGCGIVASGLPTMAAATRLAFWPPRAVRYVDLPVSSETRA
jgi:hypothetical protein